MSHFNKSQTQDKMELRRARFNNIPPKSSKYYGLASKGDTTLQTSEIKRIEYFDEIVKSYTSFEQQEIEEKVKNLTFNGEDTGCEKYKEIGQKEQFGGGFLADRHEPPPEVAATLRRLRILREALMAHEPDEFCKKVFLFSVRVSAKFRQFETYVASILYLMNNLQGLLTAAQKTEIVTILILHVSHCNLDNHRALDLFFQHLDILENKQLYGLLQAWITNDYYNWIKAYNNEKDSAISAVLSFGLERMCRSMIECMSGAYFTYPFKDMGAILPKGINWEGFKRRFEIKWTEMDGNLTIRTRTKPIKG